MIDFLYCEDIIQQCANVLAQYIAYCVFTPEISPSLNLYIGQYEPARPPSHFLLFFPFDDLILPLGQFVL